MQININNKKYEVDTMYTKIGGKKYYFDGGGGGVNFAVIQVGYPENDKKPTIITPSGKRISARDTSGLWICGVPEIGEYTITYGEATPQTVTITYKGQVESLYISEQVKNFLKIYHLGDECIDVTGEWQYNGIWKFGTSTASYAGEMQSKVNINYTDYKYCFIYVKSSINYSSIGIGNTRISSMPYVSPQFAYMYQPYTGFIIGGVITGENKVVLIEFAHSSSGFDTATVYKDANRMVFYTYGECALYSIGFLKEDDISILSAYGSDIATILNNAVELFKDRVTLQQMVMKCTGNFMISALANANFINAMNVSPNKDIIQANEVWADFLQLTTV